MDQHIVESASKTNYISNPFSMISPSADALMVNIRTLFALLGLQFSPVLLVLVAIPFALLSEGSMLPRTVALILGMMAVVGFIAIAFVSLPTYTIILLESINNQKIALRPALSRARRFVWPMLAMVILTALAVVGGFMLFIIPGFIFSAWFALSAYAMVSENLGAVASMRRSRELVRGRIWETWSLSILPQVFFLIPVFGGILNVVLSIALLPAMALRYMQAAHTTPNERPNIHWINYVLVGFVIMIVPIVLVVSMVVLFTTGGRTIEPFYL